MGRQLSRRRSGPIPVALGFQQIVHAAFIPHQRPHIPMDVPGLRARGDVTPGERDLVDHFARRALRANPLRRDPWPHRTSRLALRPPPIQQRRETLLRRRDRPVKLRRQVIAPALLQPQAGVGVELPILVQPRLDSRRNPRPPNAERTDSKTRPRLRACDADGSELRPEGRQLRAES